MKSPRSKDRALSARNTLRVANSKLVDLLFEKIIPMQLIILSCNPRTIKRSRVCIHGHLTINPPNGIDQCLDMNAR